MGSGKTTVGKKIAAKLLMNFVDTDILFEEKYNINIADFFERYGEDEFRKREQNILHETLELDNTVIATGGGMPCFFNNMDIISQAGISVFLDISPQSALARLKNATIGRPVLQSIPVEKQLEFIEKQIEYRKAFYSKAQIQRKAESIDIEELVECLKNRICRLC